ncbi:MAG: uroporphyrinogen-III C-methyltransferase [Phycisphaerae bacterium]
MTHPPKGTVYLVGAGPGDPGLLTVRGAQLLGRAEVVFYDALASPALLAHCRQARLVYVGKRAQKHDVAQPDTNRMLIDEALAGRTVVRLKGGDPFVFGRGGEECAELAAAGVPFEVVPGVTAALAATAYAGIPITHRDFNSGFAIITGHEKEPDKQLDEARQRQTGRTPDRLDYAALARLQTLCVYMGVRTLGELTGRLIEAGMRPDTPAATIQWGTTPRQRTAVGTLASIAEVCRAEGIGSPAITVIGEVVKLRGTIDWFENRPLFGRRVVVTRTRQQASDLAEMLAELGAEVIEAPMIRLEPAGDLVAVEDALRNAGGYDWLVFTSANGASAAGERMTRLGLDARALAGVKVAAVGQATAEAVKRALGILPDLVPERALAEALADALAEAGEVADRRFLLLRADIARPALAERLKAGGAACVADVPIYETRPAEALPEGLKDAMLAGDVDWVTFTSSSTARAFIDLLGEDATAAMAKVKIASIGPQTTKTLTDLGHPPTKEASTSDLAGVVEVVASGIRH